MIVEFLNTLNYEICQYYEEYNCFKIQIHNYFQELSSFRTDLALKVSFSEYILNEL